MDFFSLLVLLRKLGSGIFFFFFCSVSADQKYLDHVQGSCQETGRDHCFGPVLLPPPPPPAAAASCVLYLGGDYSAVCQSVSIIARPERNGSNYSFA